MPGSHDLSVENLRLHEHIVDSERHTAQQHIVKTATSAPTAARTTRAHSVRPPAKPDTVVSSHHSKPPASKAASKAGSVHETARHDKEILTVTVIEEDEEKDALPPAAPASSKHSSKKAVASEKKHHHAHHHHHSYHDKNNTKDIFNIPAGIPPPPGFSRLLDFSGIPKIARMSDDETRHTAEQEGHQQEEQRALMRLPPPPPARSVASAASSSSKQIAHATSSSHASKKSGKGKLPAIHDEEQGKGDADLVDVLVEEVREVTRRRFVVKVPRDGVDEWAGLRH
jgi:hypothetical protein